MKKKTISLGIFLGVGLVLTFPTSALEFKQTFAKNIVADGQVDVGEWKAADHESDFDFDTVPPTPDSSFGAVYTMGRKNYSISNSHTHKGCFSFFLHNNEWVTAESDYNYNVIHIGLLGGGAPKFSIWIFNEVDNLAATDMSWLVPSGLADVIFPNTDIDDRGFLVFNHKLEEYKHWLPGDSSPVTDNAYAYDWDLYWGFFAGGGFNNSAFDEGLPLAIDSDNTVYELIHRIGEADKCKDDISPLYDVADVVFEGDGSWIRKYWQGKTGIPVPLLVRFSSPFTATETNLGIDLNWQIDEADRNNVAQVEVWRAVSPMGEKCPSNIEKYKLETAEKLMWVRGKEVVGPQEYTYAQGNNDDCYGLRVIESSGEENWYIESVKPREDW